MTAGRVHLVDNEIGNQDQLPQARSRGGRRGQKSLALEPFQEVQGFEHDGVGPSGGQP